MPLLRADRIPIRVQRHAVRELSVALPYVAQTEDNWCWAACGEMLMRPRGIAQTQCSLASLQFHPLQCCPSPGAPHGCDKVAWPDRIYPKAGLACDPVDGQVTEARLNDELAHGRPVQVLYQWTGSSSTHVVLVVDRLADGRYAVLDPDRKVGRSFCRFSDLQSAHGDGTWNMSFTFRA